jgi:hypothetical protein
LNFREPVMKHMAAAAIAVVLLAGTAFAQEPPAAPPAGRGGRGPIVRPAELASMLDAYAIVQAQTALQLNDDQFGQFVARLKRLQENRRRNTQARNRLLQQIRAMVVPGGMPDEAALREKLKALRDHDEQAADTLRRDSAAVDEVLDPRQQALFELLEERLERQKLDLLMRARDRAARTPPPAKPGGDR